MASLRDDGGVFKAILVDPGAILTRAAELWKMVHKVRRTCVVLPSSSDT